jgi:prenyltransferase beta subunit
MIGLLCVWRLLCILALACPGASAGDEEEAVARAVDYLVKNQNRDGGWRNGLEGPSLSIYTAVALKALALA